MNTKPKSFSLLIIVAIAIVLFITAIIMNQIRSDNSEKISAPAQTKHVVNKASTIKKIDTPVSSVIDEIVSIEPDQIPSSGTNAKVSPSELDKKTSKAKLEKKLNMHLMLNTPEKVITVIEALKKQGRDDEANEYIEYLLEKFPDYQF